MQKLYAEFTIRVMIDDDVFDANVTGEHDLFEGPLDDAIASIYQVGWPGLRPGDGVRVEVKETLRGES